MHGLDRKDLRVNQRHHRARVVHGRAFIADGLVELVEELQPLRDDIAHGISQRADALEVLRHDERLFRYVETCHEDGDAGLEDDLCRLGVHQNVEFRRGRPVAVGDAAAHEGNLLDLRLQFRMRQQKRRHVGLRTCGNDRDRLGRLAQDLCHQLDRAKGRNLHRRLGKRRTVEPGFSVDRRRVHHVIGQRMGAALGDGGVDAKQRTHTKGVVGGLFDADVAAARSHGKDVKSTAALRQGPADGVVMTGVAVQNDGDFFQFRHSTSN